MSEDVDPPVVGSSSLEKPAACSKWSLRGRRMRRTLLLAWKVVALVVAMFRAVRWVIGNL